MKKFIVHEDRWNPITETRIDETYFNSELVHDYILNPISKVLKHGYHIELETPTNGSDDILKRCMFGFRIIIYNNDKKIKKFTFSFDDIAYMNEDDYVINPSGLIDEFADFLKGYKPIARYLPETFEEDIYIYTSDIGEMFEGLPVSFQ